MRADKDDKLKRAVELEAAGLERGVIAQRLGISTSRVANLLKLARQAAAKE